MIAANIEVSSGEESASEQQSMEQSIQIEQVTLPPQRPPDVPPEEVPPDFQQAPSEDIPEPDAIAMATPVPARPTPTPLPTQTPSVSNTPSPQSSPTPAPTPTPGVTAEPTPVPQPSPSAAPSPTPTPDASASLPPQFANLPEKEQEAAKSLKKYLEEQNLDLPEELPFGFESWEDYNKFLNSDYNSQAKDLAKLPDPTKGSDGGAASGADSSQPSADPGTNGTGDGTTDGNGDGSGKSSGSWFSIPGAKKPRFDTNLNADDLKKPNLNGDFDSDGNLFGNKSLDDLSKTRDLQFDPDAPLVVPTPTPIPLPSVLQGDIGDLLMYLSFKYDGNTFKAQWSSEAERNKKVTVQYYPIGKPEGLKGFDMPWVPAFEEDPKQNITQAALQVYERRKSQGK